MSVSLLNCAKPPPPGSRDAAASPCVPPSPAAAPPAAFRGQLLKFERIQAHLELHMRDRVIRDLRAGSGFGGKFARYEVWRSAMRHREWISRCGENVLFNAYRWAHQADGDALLITDEGDILSTQTLTSAEAYHNMVWEMKPSLSSVKSSARSATSS